VKIITRGTANVKIITRRKPAVPLCAVCEKVLRARVYRCPLAHVVCSFNLHGPEKVKLVYSLGITTLS